MSDFKWFPCKSKKKNNNLTKWHVKKKLFMYCLLGILFNQRIGIMKKNYFCINFSNLYT